MKLHEISLNVCTYRGWYSCNYYLCVQSCLTAPSVPPFFTLLWTRIGSVRWMRTVLIHFHVIFIESIHYIPCIYKLKSISAIQIQMYFYFVGDRMYNIYGEVRFWWSITVWRRIRSAMITNESWRVRVTETSVNHHSLLVSRNHAETIYSAYDEYWW